MLRNYRSMHLTKFAVITITGTLIMFCTLIFMILNLYRADSVINSWLPIMATGICITFLGILLQSGESKENKRFRFLREKKIRF